MCKRRHNFLSVQRLCVYLYSMTVSITVCILAAAVTAAVTFLVARSVSVRKVAGLEAEKQGLLRQLDDRNEVNERFVQELRTQHESRIGELKNQYDAQLEQQKKQSIEQMKLFQDSLELKTRDILKKRQDELQAENSVRMEAIMKPLKEEIRGLHEQLNRNREDGAAKEAHLSDMIKGFAEQASQIGAASDKLANAMLSNGKVHGDWGEQVLQQILENSGMVENVNYRVQSSSKDEEGRELRPDVYIMCPGNREIIIDSKVSLTAYANYLDATEKTDADKFREQNCKSVKAQVDRLAGKEYHKLEQNIYSTVLMFIPNEGAYILAMRHDPELAQYAYNKGVVILTPTNLMLTLQLINGLWQKENEEKNIQKILETAGALYDKFSGFSDSMAAIKKGLEQSATAYDEALKQLCEGKGNVVKRIEDLRSLGARYSKNKSINGRLAAADSEPDDTPRTCLYR